MSPLDIGAVRESAYKGTGTGGQEGPYVKETADSKTKELS